MTFQESFKRPKLNKKETKIYQTYIKKLSTWILQKVTSANQKGISLGISGGIDSSLLAVICKQIPTIKTYFYHFKTSSNPEIERNINLLAKKFDLNIETIDLSDEFNSLTSKLSINSNQVLGNLKSRLYMSSLYALSQKNETLVCGTDNYDEHFLGYFTKYGDGGCDILPIANIKKSDVYALANMLGVPDEIIDRKPSADLCENQSDEGDLGFSYETFEKWLIDPNLVSKEIADSITHYHKISNHKRLEIPRGPKLK
ncbi:NAD+ synthetase [Metamycoplasma arthritidis]|uniref:NH(3)-dependent NAD(+) synthetase n=1 Tax=Metamycoplasma arthritidis (strain 158L3-1) TaxID=243272 RepID=B3PMC7_META1|nr:NAD(+) synthase [Metamycoplasma arthritidis]ACF07179.1 NH(3)-dependent NAD+ synthetase [Metamycoplasma arthritidis 158L3-1]VEU78703.1 NAD+ synthetase [Metamycoplasma arthritidis]